MSVMATLIGIGSSTLIDPIAALKEAAIEVKGKLNIISADLVIVLFTSGYMHKDGLEVIHKILQPKHLVGSITTGIILSDGIKTRGVAILALTSDEFHITTSAIEQFGLTALHSSGLDLARSLEDASKIYRRQACLLFFNGLFKNNSPFFHGLQEGLGRLFTIVGGVGADAPLPKTSLHCHDHAILTDGAVGVLISGQDKVAVASYHGWQPLGKPRIVTLSEGNIIRLIDNQPALTIYENYFADELSKKEPGALGDIGLLYPLGISDVPGEPYILRHPVQVLVDGSIVCQSEVPIGARVHLMIGKKESIEQAATRAAASIKEQLAPKQPKLLFIFASNARHKIFGRNAHHEIRAIKEIIGLTTPVFGMYTYGEIAPLNEKKTLEKTLIQNASIVLTAIGSFTKTDPDYE
jgi:hypothetical protein